MRPRRCSSTAIRKPPGSCCAIFVNATVGFEGLAAATRKPAKSLYRMLSTNRQPEHGNLAAIFDVVRKRSVSSSRLVPSKPRRLEPFCERAIGTTGGDKPAPTTR